MPGAERDYSDIIDLPHHVSPTRPRMSKLGRAAQFAPFAALTGYGASIAEADRLTQRRIELSQTEQAELSAKLSALNARLPCAAEVTWFIPDPRKAGGRYVTERLEVRQILPAEGRLALAGGESLDLDNVIDVEMER